MKKILILHTSVGLGHKMIAENLGAAFARGGFEVKTEDIGKIQKGKFQRSLVSVHQFINKRLPFVWTFLYKWGHFIFLPFRVFIAGFNYKQTAEIVRQFRPDVIITVQTTASAVISYLKKKKIYQGPFGIAFSDFHLHRYWLYKQADFYLANIEEQKKEMINLGIPQEKIYICGMTIKPKPEINKQAVREKFGISENEKVVLVGIGSLGIGLNLQMLENFRKNLPATLIVVCGKNEELYKQLKVFESPKFIVLGFYNPMAELYAIADVFITKPGGLTTTESLQWHLPMIVTHFLPGQEELNINYLVRKNLIIMPFKNLLTQIMEEADRHLFRRRLEVNPTVLEIVQTGELAVKVVRGMLHGL